MIIEKILSLYRPSYLLTVVYMLQSTEYSAGPYLKWYWRTNNFANVMRRRQLQHTKVARLFLLSLAIGALLEVLAGLWLVSLDMRGDLVGGAFFGLAVIIAYPIVWAHLIVLPLLLGKWFIAGPKERRLVAQSEKVFAEHRGKKIAVAGSYGKTTMKELLNTVLGEGKLVAATPANKNVTISHAKFARNLSGKEDILIIEYGEGEPGDVARFAKYTKPTHAIITGLAPAHLDRYKTLERAGKDIFSLADYLSGKNVYINGESSAVKPFLKDSYEVFSQKGALGWQVQDVKVSINGLSFSIHKGKRGISLKSSLLGRHQVGSLTLAAALGLEFGMNPKQVEAGVAKTAPFEHRMQPYQLNGAWIIDDTYNGNIEGVRAGTILLKELSAKRKIYVTPGLVDQGGESAKIHTEMGWLIAAAQPDIVVLMQNSVTKYIQRGLKESNFAGEVKVEPQPLKFYTNLQHFVAAGDLVLMQNDWTDNYA